jgi:hypothetical protein
MCVVCVCVGSVGVRIVFMLCESVIVCVCSVCMRLYVRIYVYVCVRVLIRIGVLLVWCDRKETSVGYEGRKAGGAG